MVFSSPAFLFLFLPIVLWARFLFRSNISIQNLLLLAASLYFYTAGEGKNIALLLFCIAMNFSVGLLLSRDRTPLSRVVLALGIAGNLALLASFKYANYFAELASAVTGNVVDLAPVALPLGISFFTFQSMSYLIDVYRGVAEAQKNPFRLALYIALFPQLIAGPIVRYSHIASQIATRTLSNGDFAQGVRRFIIGLGKKVLIADNLAPVVSNAFDSVADIPDPALAWLGVLCFAGQIYFDFSGYSDMAIGIAKMFGFNLRENFEHPYESRSVVEFWRRWHISLTTWFRDYLYIPLGGNRCPSLRRSLNLWIVFVLCGLWHGASNNFIAWGVYHGSFLVLERSRFAKLLNALPRPLAQTYTFVVVLLGWVLFRATDLPRAVAHLNAMAKLPTQAWSGPDSITLRLQETIDPLIALAMLCALLFATRGPTQWIVRLIETSSVRSVVSVAKDVGLAACLLACLISASATTYHPFLYFRF